MLQYNTSHLYKILKDFYTVTKIRIAMFDSEFNELLSYPKERIAFCEILRKDPDFNEKCVSSDRNGCLQCAKTKEFFLYRCHAGLTEAVVPIYDSNGVIGYIFFGHILPKDGYDAAKAQLKRRYADRYFPGIGAAIDQIPSKTTEELNASATILQALTSYVMTNRWVTPGKSEFIRQLDHYIETHLGERISVEDLCAEFHMGRTRLYSVSTDYLGFGLAEYIRRQRIIYAQKMLTETDYPITDIAYATGFSDYNSFSRTFKQTCQISAREYRRVKGKSNPAGAPR